MLETDGLLFEWDELKDRENRRKHRVSFMEAKTVFSDPLLVTYTDDAHSEDEERFISIGLSARQRLLLVVHTERGYEVNLLIIRIISSRKATILERRAYEEDNI
jgi:uncharacterized DUF497 family protein